MRYYLLLWALVMKDLLNGNILSWVRLQTVHYVEYGDDNVTFLAWDYRGLLVSLALLDNLDLR